MSWIQAVVLFAVLFACMKPLGMHMARVYSGKRTFLHPVLGWVEHGFYKLSGINPEREMSWSEYAFSLIVFSAISIFALYALLIWQDYLPFNPAGLPGLSHDLAFNTAVSFATNTGWQSYVPETTMSPFSQTVGLTVHNFLSPAISMAVMAAVVRGFTCARASGVGNFWADLVRGILYILLPLAVILAIALVAEGVVQTFSVSFNAIWLDASIKPERMQTIATGPAASMVAIKQLSSTGGGYFNANSAHPFENPTPLTNFLETLAILLIPVSQCAMFGRMARNSGQGWTLLVAMTLIFIPMFVFVTLQEQGGNPNLTKFGVDQTVNVQQSGGNMEGKETRFGVAASTLWAASSTATSNGSVNASIDSFMPLGGMVPIMLMQFDEAVFGGVGSGLFSMLLFVVLTVFFAGLMVGRTPEYLGKKIQVFEIKMAALAMLVPHIASLAGAALAMITASGKAGAFNPGAQGFSEILYAFTSAANTNGSSMAGLISNTPFYNIALGITMLAGRFLIIIPVLAMGGSLARKNAASPAITGSLLTSTPLFAVILAATVVTISIIAFMPTMALGPVAEHFHLLAGARP